MGNIGAIEILIVMDDNIDVLIEEFSTWGPVRRCVCNCPTFTCALLLDLDDDVFTYYRTSQFGVFNPTTDFSTVFTPTTIDATISFSTFTSVFTSFTSVFSSFTSVFTRFTSFTSVTSIGNSSSDASLVSASIFAVVSIAALM